MDFRHVPELSGKRGYPLALSLCLASVILPLVWFKWHDWI